MSERPTNEDLSADPELWDTLARYLAGECEPGEADRVRRWLEAQPDRVRLLSALDASLGSLRFQTPPDLDVEAALARVTARLDEAEVHELRPPAARHREPVRTRWTTMSLRVAAVLALLFAGALVWRVVKPPESEVIATVQVHETRVGQIDSVRLADGTNVVLGPDSRLTVASGYGGGSREVELSGEALFDVPHDDAKPFIVHAGGASIRDLGTTFSVRNEPGEEVRVVVTSGSVLLQPSDAGDAPGVTLAAGEYGVLRADGTASAEAVSSPATELAWTTGRLIFQDAPLSRVATELRRWYGVELVADSALTSRRLTATFHGETRQQAIEIVALALGASLQQRGDTAYLGLLELEAPAR